MKTNQTLTVSVNSATITIEHLSGYGSLTDVFTAGNQMRLQDDKKPAQLTAFLQSERTKDYIAAATLAWHLPEDKPLYYVKGRGNKKVTMAHLSLMIYAAEYLSSTFHAYMIKTFIQSKLLEIRDQSGDEFNMMNHYIDLYLPEREDNKGIFVNVAKLLKNKIKPNHGDWNTATADQLRQRYAYEKSLSDMLRTGVIKNFNHLKEIIEKL